MTHSDSMKQASMKAPPFRTFRKVRTTQACRLTSPFQAFGVFFLDALVTVANRSEDSRLSLQFILQAWKTRKYTKGHFDRTAVHQESGSEYVFGPSSFQSFERDPEQGCFFKGVYFITRAGTLTGMGSGEINTVSHRIATDLDFQEALEKRDVSAIFCWSSFSLSYFEHFQPNARILTWSQMSACLTRPFTGTIRSFHGCNGSTTAGM